MDICSSPKLIAACHVLHRLLMPRHSPCALYSLTCRRCKLHIPRFGLRPKLTHSAAPPLSPKTDFRRGDERTRILRSLLLQSEKFGSLELCRLHKDFSEIVIVTHLYDVPQLNLRLSRFRVTTSLLPYLLVIHCSVFKVQTRLQSICPVN